jgi:hypothetical protein
VTVRRLGALAVALGAALSGCSATTGGGGTLTPGASITPSAAATSVTRAQTPQIKVDPLSERELTRRGETLAVNVQRRTAFYASPGGHVLFHLTPKTSFGSPRGMAVMRRKGDWLGVTAEDLANGHLAWVRRGDVHLQRVTWKIHIDLSKRRGVLLHQGKRYGAFALGIGTPTYKTPTGRFGVTDRLAGVPGGPYGCCALALTAHQPNVPQDWPGGDRIAVHGTPDPSSVGVPSTHGCLRADDDSMQLLMAKVPIGTQVVIQE